MLALWHILSKYNGLEVFYNVSKFQRENLFLVRIHYPELLTTFVIPLHGLAVQIEVEAYGTVRDEETRAPGDNIGSSGLNLLIFVSENVF